MDQTTTINFEGQKYYDDRIFILYLCKSKITADGEGFITTTIYHDHAPEDHIWSVVTYRNCSRYRAYRIDSFYKREDAENYLQMVEPTTPLISLGGKTPNTPLSYKDYCSWKIKNGYKEYDWQEMYKINGRTMGFDIHTENIMEYKNQFRGVK